MVAGAAVVGAAVVAGAASWASSPQDEATRLRVSAVATSHSERVRNMLMLLIIGWKIDLSALSSGGRDWEGVYVGFEFGPGFDVVSAGGGAVPGAYVAADSNIGSVGGYCLEVVVGVVE